MVKRTASECHYFKRGHFVTQFEMNDQKIRLTGNPFVDTGLAVIAVLGGLDDIERLTLQTVRNVYGDGEDIARWNCRLKSFSQIFGTNNPLFQNAYGYKKSSGPSSLNYAIYQQTLKNFLKNVNATNGQLRCEACGNLTNFDFSAACTSAIESSGEKAPGTKWIGRDWFPLAGSLGSDAQALPAASRAAQICPLCLFAVHYLPLGVTLIDGRLAVFQSTSTEFWYDLLNNIVKDIQSRTKAGIYETIGAKEGSRALAKCLFQLFEDLQKGALFHHIPPGTTLFVWRFSNAGASPDCSLEEIPNPALVFLYKAVDKGFRNELEKFIEDERKPENSLLRCISERRDYPALYPRSKHQGASPELFSLYQIEIRGRTVRTLFIAKKLAQRAHEILAPKELSRLQREERFETGSQNRFRQLMANMCSQGELTWGDYLELFPLMDQDSGIQVSSDGWNLIRFFLQHSEIPSDIASIEPSSIEIPPQDGQARLVWFFAAVIFADFIQKPQTDVLNRISRGEISTKWLREQFVKFAEREECFTFATWSILSKLPNGQIAISELLFQMRLLWIQWTKQRALPSMISISCPISSGLPPLVEKYLEKVGARYVEDHSIKRFHRDILLRLRRREIGIQWFRKKFVSSQEPFFSEEQWNAFLKDDEGCNIVAERLFQLHLVLAHFYRMQTQIREEVV